MSGITIPKSDPKSRKVGDGVLGALPLSYTGECVWLRLMSSLTTSFCKAGELNNTDSWI